LPLKGTPPNQVEPGMVLYLTCGEETGPGKVYQVDESGRILGIVPLPYTGTGIALHRQTGVVVAIPRDGGKIMRIDDSGKLSTLVEKDKGLAHPVDVALAGDSDSVLIADNMAHLLAATTTVGGATKVYQRLEGQKWATPPMAIAVTRDRHVLYSTDTPEGVYRFSGDENSAARGPLLPGFGGVAADPASLKWAAAQKPNQIYVFEGEELCKKIRLSPNKVLYRDGLLSFGPAGALVVANRPSDDATGGQVWLVQYNTENDGVRSLFPWDKEPIQDFVVGPRMYWDRRSPNSAKSTY
jgi:hypothetical protein